jgi:arginase
VKINPQDGTPRKRSNAKIHAIFTILEKKCKNQITENPQIAKLSTVVSVGGLQNDDNANCESSRDQKRRSETTIRNQAMPTFLGIPLDVNSSYLRGPAGAPAKIREAWASDASNKWSELGLDLSAAGAFADAGDLRLSNSREKSSADLAEIERAVGELLQKGEMPVSLGGDHSVTYPILRAFARRYPELTIVHFDAHPDLYDEYEGSRVSHACPFARIMEERLAKRLVQIGIRTLNRHQREQAEKFGVEIVQMPALPAYDRLKFHGPVYISFDMDVLDPAFAPGVSHREPGGMTVREAIAHLHRLEGAIVGADLVEYNPTQDISGITATVVAKILKEMLGKMTAG